MNRTISRYSLNNPHYIGRGIGAGVTFEFNAYNCALMSQFSMAEELRYINYNYKGPRA